MPILSMAGCNAGACHGNAKGKNGFRLSLRGQSPGEDYWSLTRDMLSRRVNRSNPERSLLLLKPTGAVPHEGGVRFVKDSEPYRILLGWISGGMRDDHDSAPSVRSLKVTPSERILFGSKTQRLTVTATFDDGSVRDVTSLSAYDTSSPIVEVDSHGLASFDSHGEVAILVRFGGEMSVSQLAAFAERPQFDWKPVPESNYIDRLVLQKLRRQRINPSGLSSDQEFLRRVYLDTLGRLPTVAESIQFLDGDSPRKRNELIDSLLGRPEFADFWSLKWSDLLRNEEKVIDRTGVVAYHRWIRDFMDRDEPLSRFVHELLTAEGSTYKQPATNFYRANRDPTVRAETAAQLFLGIRLQCARCHNHPFERWTQDDYYQFAAFFARVQYKIVENKRRDKLDKHAFNGEQIVWNDEKSQVIDPRTGKPAAPRFLGTHSLLPATTPSRLQAIADWVTDESNEYFSRTLANRIWFHLLGRGLVNPIDDFRLSNPATNELLLQALADDLRTHDFRLKHLVRRILRSQIYQLSWRPNSSNEFDEQSFSHSMVRLIGAESLLDAISDVMEVPEQFPGYPPGTRAIQLAGVQSQSAFLKRFGKPERLLTCECERSGETTLSQAFQMISGQSVSSKLNAEGNRIDRLLDGGKSNSSIIEEFYLAALSRYPNSSELNALLELFTSEDRQSRRERFEDIVWSLLNSKEFLLRR